MSHIVRYFDIKEGSINSVLNNLPENKLVEVMGFNRSNSLEGKGLEIYGMKDVFIPIQFGESF